MVAEACALPREGHNKTDEVGLVIEIVGRLGNNAIRILLSAFSFVAAQAFYQNWVSVILSFYCGLALSLSYRRTSSFLTLGTLHSLVGQILFASGLGIFFYHGTIN